MGEPKAFASLSSGLLARKGAARPAMRPQGFGQAEPGSKISAGTTWASNRPSRPSLRSAMKIMTHSARNWLTSRCATRSPR